MEEIVDGLSHGGVDDDAGWRSPLPSPRSGYIRSCYETGAVQVSSDDEEEEAGGEEKGEMAERPRWQHDDSMQVECGVGSREVGRRTVRRLRGAGGVLLGRVLGEEERAFSNVSRFNATTRARPPSEQESKPEKRKGRPSAASHRARRTKDLAS